MPLNLWLLHSPFPLSVPGHHRQLWTQGEDQVTPSAHVVTEREHRTLRRLAAQQDSERLTR
ncbi:hypothetical protein [Deinococcus navajonensis]|uniref:Transposase n=1 Tax=Deinococcus navajonensis TaxID=309884 RepID=A0ABV8XMV4_9DEIO